MNLFDVFMFRTKATLTECRSSLNSKVKRAFHGEEKPDWILNEFGFPVLESDPTQTAPSSKIYELLDKLS